MAGNLISLIQSPNTIRKKDFTVLNILTFSKGK